MSFPGRRTAKTLGIKTLDIKMLDTKMLGVAPTVPIRRARTAAPTD